MWRIISWPAVGAVSALLLLAGCAKEPERAGVEIMEQTFQMEPTARLSIHNLSGSISIRGADTSQLSLHATKKTASVAQLEDINIRVAAEPGSVSISTSILPRKNKSLLGAAQTVDYVLVVPRTIKIARLDLDDGKVFIEGMEGEDVRANVVDGEMTLRGCCGDIHVAVANGDLDLAYQDCAQRPFVADAQVTHGNARIFLPRTASLRLRAATASGTLANDFTDMVEVNGRPAQKIDMAVGPDARAQLNVRVTRGDISIAAVKSEPAGALTASSAGSE